jgi:hypothetical protein
MKSGSLLLLTAFWLVGCHKSSLSDKLTSGAGCLADDTDRGVSGRCPNDQLFCDLGMFDRDGVPSNGCESLLKSSDNYRLFALDEYNGSAGIVVNGEVIGPNYMPPTVTGGRVAMAGPPCKATLDSPCHYDLLAVQIRLSSFVFDTLPWADGLIELPKPISLTDNGKGSIFPEGTIFTVSFMVDPQKRVISAGPVRGHAQMTSDGTRVSIRIESDQPIPFGDYTVDAMIVGDFGTLVTHPPASGGNG